MPNNSDHDDNTNDSTNNKLFNHILTCCCFILATLVFNIEVCKGQTEKLDQQCMYDTIVTK